MIGYHGAKAKGCQRGFYKCGVAHAKDTPGWSRHDTHHTNYRNPASDAKDQQDLQKDFSILLVHCLARRTGSEMEATVGTEEAAFHKSLLRLPI